MTDPLDEARKLRISEAATELWEAVWDNRNKETRALPLVQQVKEVSIASLLLYKIFAMGMVKDAEKRHAEETRKAEMN